MSERRTVPIVCARAPRHIVYVPAIQGFDKTAKPKRWTCSWCGARVRVVA